ncbi:MAG: hypothetical protein ACM3ZC_05030 [Bacteroidota bacterium]
MSSILTRASRGLLFMVLALSLAASVILSAEASLSPSGDVLKFTATSSESRASTKYWYWMISNEAYTFQKGDALEYDVYLETDGPGLGAVEVFNNDGTWFRDQEDWLDQNGRRGHPGTDIAKLAFGKWYHRVMKVPSGMIGKTSGDFSVAVEFASRAKTYVTYYDNIVITNKGQVVKKIYTDGQPTVNESRGGQEYTCQLEVVPLPKK